jgi:hypothetical protein
MVYLAQKAEEQLRKKSRNYVAVVTSICGVHPQATLTGQNYHKVMI